MAAVVFNWEVEQGATSTLIIRYKDADNNPVPLVGYAGRGQARLKLSDPTPLCDFVVNISDPAQGVITVSLPADALAGYTFRAKSHNDLITAVYDVEVFTPAGLTHRVINGSLIISPEVTKL